MPYLRRVSIFLLLLLTLLFFLFFAVSCQNEHLSATKSPGEKTFRALCSSCHNLPSPKYYSLDTVLEQIEEHKLTKKINLTKHKDEELISYLQETFNQK